MLERDETQVRGNPVDGQVSLSKTDDSLSFYMTEECIKATCPPYEFAALLAETCGIKDPSHYTLLYTVLTNPDLNTISSIFVQRGIYVKILGSGK
jgi:hypothetical protein